MKPSRALLVLGIATALGLTGCKAPNGTAPAANGTTAVSTSPENETADQFIARVNEEYRKSYPELTSAQWLSSTYINEDSELVSAKANERYLAQLRGWIEQSRRFEGQTMSRDTARAIQLLKLQAAMPPPRDPAKLAELTAIATRMEGAYGKGEYCTGEGPAKTCRQLGDLEDVLAKSRDYDAQLDAWQGWHSTAAAQRKDYTRFVSLINEGARDLGYADAGELWRSGYDMTPAQLSTETDRLWGQVKPLYEQLHCYAGAKLDAKYGANRGHVAGHMLPAHLMGNMWQQDWSNLWDLLAPYPTAGSLDINAALDAQYKRNVEAETAKITGERTPAATAQAEHDALLATAKQMNERAQDFYVSLGMPKLPATYWDRTQFIKPRDRDVVCHASAWDMNMAGDVRTKMCIKRTEEDFTTIYHELGHVYYYLAYNKLPPIFQSGAHDGFHEAIGDTIVLSMTPSYLHQIGLVDQPQVSNEALINAQMRMALAKVSFLPFGLMIDRWRWGVFDGSITPANYNTAWWQLKAKYQGVAPPTPRGETFFDPGAKYHVPANTPYTRYFLSHVLQFQFYKALCDASGFKGPLYECSFYNNPAAGRRYWAMLSRGAGQPWQATLKEMTGSDRMDASALLEYFAPLQTWLKQQNEGRTCGWQADAATSAPPATSPVRSTPATSEMPPGG